MAHASDLIASDINAYLESHQHKSLLRFITCGSVDDGKSTLIGRLLYESKMIFEDQLTARLAVKGIWLQEQALAGEAAQQIGFGQRRPLIGRIGFVTDHGDGACVPFPAKALDGLHPRLAGADNDNLFRHGFSAKFGRG